jgi:EmrB/QacA subfamily drug resistance transporter
LTVNTLSQNQDHQEIESNLGISRKQAFLTFGIVSLALIMSGIDSTIVTVGLPSILGDLKTNLAYAGWVITGYQFSQAIMMPIVGKISDEWGRKRVFMSAVVIFTVSSIAAGFAPNIYTLIVFRVLQGVGGGAFLPSATGIISDAFGKRRSTAIGLFASIFPIGGIIGPNLGGFLIDRLSWRWIFFVNIPIGLLLVILGTLILPKSKAIPSQRRIDVPGAVLFSLAILAVMYAMTTWANDPQGVGPLTWILFALGAVFLYLFVRQENRAKQPMIELKLLLWKPFLAANIFNFIYGAIVFGLFAFIPLYANVAYGMTASQSGLILTPRSVAMIVVAAFTSFFIIRFRYRLPMIMGAVTVAAGFFLISRGFHDISIMGLEISNMVLLILFVMLGGIGMGMINPSANNAVLDMVPEKAAAVTGMRGMFRMTGGIFGTSAVVLALSHFQDEAIGLERIALYFAIVLIVTIPIIFMIPDAAQERRNKLNASHDHPIITE